MLTLLENDPEYYKYELNVMNGEKFSMELYGLGGEKDFYKFIAKYPQIFGWDELQNMPIIVSDKEATLEILKDAADLCPGVIVIYDENDEEIYPE